MDDQTIEIICGVVLILIFIGLIKGAIKTFSRNWIAALLLFLFLFPIWCLWAFFEMFTGDIIKITSESYPNSQSVNVTVIHKTDGTFEKLTTTQKQELPNIMNDEHLRTHQLLTTSAHESAYTTKICPYCAEEIKSNAVICRFCNRDV